MRSRFSSPVRASMLVAALALLPGVSAAGSRDHLGGFFLRLSAGAGTVRTELTSRGNTLALSGAASDVNIAIGGVIAPNLALHGTLYGWLADDPDFEVGGRSVATRAQLDLSAIGAGVTYYFMPINIYLSGSLGAGSLAIDGPTGEGETGVGLVMDLTAGKEWWVSDRWGLGVAVGFGYHDIPEKFFPVNWSGTGLAVRFTATLN
jgi:hypothetical protein